MSKEKNATEKSMTLSSLSTRPTQSPKPEKMFPRDAASIGPKIILHYLSAFLHPCLPSALVSVITTASSSALLMPPKTAAPIDLRLLSHLFLFFKLPSSHLALPCILNQDQWHHSFSPDPGPSSPSPLASASPPSTQHKHFTGKNRYYAKLRVPRL